MYSKGSGPVSAVFAVGGPALTTTNSKFLKTPDVFREDIERTDYKKSSKGGEQSKTEGDSKSLTPIKPRK